MKEVFKITYYKDDSSTSIMYITANTKEDALSKAFLINKLELSQIKDIQIVQD